MGTVERALRLPRLRTALILSRSEFPVLVKGWEWDRDRLALLPGVLGVWCVQSEVVHVCREALEIGEPQKELQSTTGAPSELQQNTGQLRRVGKALKILGGASKRTQTEPGIMVSHPQTWKKPLLIGMGQTH